MKKLINKNILGIGFGALSFLLGTVAETRHQSMRDEALINAKVKKEIKVIDNMIGKLAKYVSLPRRNNLSRLIWKVSQKHKLHPQLIVAIIDTESDFIKGRISVTGDLSIAQINPKVWNKEMARLGKKIIDVDLLQNDEEYALKRMGEILGILKSRYEKEDFFWYCRYHSNMKKFKFQYFRKIQDKLFQIASI